MQTSSKVIVTCAVTGPIHTLTMSLHLPITPNEIVDAARPSVLPQPKCTDAVGF